MKSTIASEISVRPHISMSNTIYFKLNEFPLQVVPDSGRGWQMFQVEGVSGSLPGGNLKSVKPLDFENPKHRQGFDFKVQVTDVVSVYFLSCDIKGKSYTCMLPVIVNGNIKVCVCEILCIVHLINLIECT